MIGLGVGIGVGIGVEPSAIATDALAYLQWLDRSGAGNSRANTASMLANIG